MKLQSWQPFPGPPANSPLQPTYHRRNKCVMLVSAKAVWSLSSLRNTHLRVWVFCRTQANVQHFSAVWKLSLAGARKDDLNLGVVFSSLQSTAPGVINDGLGGDRHPGTQTASLTLSLAISL